MENSALNQNIKFNKDIEILSFKRKSDGKIFSIGDKFKWFSKGTIEEDPECGSYDQTFKGTIKEFRILGGQLNIMHLHRFSHKYNNKVFKGSNMINLCIKNLI